MIYLKLFKTENDYNAVKDSIKSPAVSYCKEIDTVYYAYKENPDVPTNQIWYVTTNETTVTPFKTDVFGANIVSNTYENGKGIITFDGDVTTIGHQAFYNCTSLSSIIIGNGVTSISTQAFSSCSKLSSIIIPNSVTSIGSSIFHNCTSLLSITIPDSVTSIGGSLFSNCTSLSSIVVSSGNTVYDSRNNCNAIIETSSNTLIEGCYNTIIPDSVTSIDSSAFQSCTSLSSITIPDSVTSIGESAFDNCTSLSSITIPDSVTSIGRNVFKNCTSLSSIVVSSGNTVYDSLNNCNAIIETATNTLIQGCYNTIIPDSVTSIDYGAFYGCSKLSSITIPDSVTSIDYYAFYNCSSLSEITCLAITAPSIKSNTFRYVKTGGILKYPSGSDYSTWLQTGNYYLGKYNWTGQEILDE